MAKNECKWFYGKPKVPGYYWCLLRGREGYTIVNFTGDLERGFSVCGNPTPFSVKDFRYDRWCGPINPPKIPIGRDEVQVMVRAVNGEGKAGPWSEPVVVSRDDVEVLKSVFGDRCGGEEEGDG